MRFQLYTGAENRFLLLEEEGGLRDHAPLARELCQRPVFDGERADGLLVLRREANSTWRMILFNADGSRAEACGNGLRCVGWHLARLGDAEVFEVHTDAGKRRVELVRHQGVRAHLVGNMGCAEVSLLYDELPSLDGVSSAHRVLIGNPHCVLRVASDSHAEVDKIGHELQSHPIFPQGVNVGFLSFRLEQWNLRVFERGVGETAACGTGACAAAATLIGPGEEMLICMRGGPLIVRRLLDESLELFGEAVYRGECELSVRA